jgi:fructokinase
VSRGRRRIGIDLGGTKIEGVVIEGSSRTPVEVVRERIPTAAEQGYEHILAQVADLARKLEADAGPDASLGVGMPGSVTAAGRVKNSNTVCLNGTAFRSELSERLGRQVLFANDANCFALAEARLGAGRGHRMVFGVILGTGVGGGLVIDGRAREGPQSICGEWGHMVLRPGSDRACYCGQQGCVETHLAGPWVERDFAARAHERLLLPDILERRAEGDTAATACIDAWLDDFGRALANLINALDPDAIVLGGGVSRADCLYEEGRTKVAEYLFSDELLTPILRHELGDSAGVLGAALLGEDQPGK